ncbi:hypothetical protein C8R44DRAFT_677276, partial [Mycena epipterygia]
MDAVGFVTSVVALVQGAGALLEYIQDVKDGPNERAELLRGVAALPGLLTSLKDQFDNTPPTTAWATATRSLAITDGPFAQLGDLLQRVESKLKTPPTRIGQLKQILKWTLDKGDVAEVLIKVERVKSLIMLALQNDHVALSREIQKDVQQLHQKIGDISNDLTLVFGQVEDVSRGVSRAAMKIEGVGRDVFQKVEPIASGVKQLQDHNLNADLRAFAQWLSPLDFEATQENFFSKCAAGTGDWFINHPEFQRWISGDISLLWCPGKPGVGKTILSSRVVNHLQRNVLQLGIGVTYIFFDYNQSSSQTPPAIMGSILRQLLIDSPSVPESVKPVHALFTSGRTRPSGLSDLVIALKAQLQLYTRVYLVVDALDEYSANRNNFIAEIRSLMDTGGLQVLITSRDISTIKHQFQNNSCINVLAHHEDVCSYIAERMQREERLKTLLNGDTSLEQDIVAKVTEKAAGMFLLVQLHMDTLASKNNRKALRDALAALPKEIYRSYDDVMNRIDSQGVDDSQLARKLFLWLAHAKRQLLLQEIQYALAIYPGMLEMDLDAITSVEILTSVCAGLVIVEHIWGGEYQFRFVHYTTQEYFQLEGSQQHFRLNEIMEYFDLPLDLTFPFANFAITTTCITYLCFQGLNMLNDRGNLDQNQPLLEYSVKYWGHHAETCEHALCTIPKARNLMLQFFQSESEFTHGFYEVFHSYEYSYSRHVYQFPHVLAIFGHVGLMVLILDHGADINCLDSQDRTPLILAVMYGHLPMVKFLMERGRHGIVELLSQQNGVDPNTPDSDLRTPLSYAAEKGHYGIIELLLQQNGVNPNAPDSNSRTPLSYA